MKLKFTAAFLPLLLGVFVADACRLNSEHLKGYARRTVEKLLKPDQFGEIYWPDEPLAVHSLSKAIGLNVSVAETHFSLGPPGGGSHYEKRKNEIGDAAKTDYRNGGADSRASLIQDIFVACSIDRDRNYALTINLEVENPFKVVDIYHEPLRVAAAPAEGGPQGYRKGSGSFRIKLPQSSLLVQLSQRIKYDDCLTVNYVQLSPSVNYLVECEGCDGGEQEYLDKIFHKRMSQFDSELDALLSEKVLFGLQVLLSQQRLDLDTYME